MARNNQMEGSSYAPMAAAIAGAAVGAIAGYLLSNEDNRKAVVKAAHNVRQQGMKKLEEGRGIAHQLSRSKLVGDMTDKVRSKVGRKRSKKADKDTK
jgi:hypothetical protein